MFGLYRSLLACLVLFHHLAGVHLVGQYAVHGFFVLSGFLMTHIMHRAYGYDARGRLAFAANRALRLYPSYWATLALAVMAIAFTGAAVAQEFRAFLFLPHGVADWLQNVTMVYVDTFPNRVSPRLSPASWALTIELFYYALIALGLSRTVRITWLWFAVGAAFQLWAAVTMRGLDHAYFHILSGAMPFSIGALLWFYQDRIRLPRTGAVAGAMLGTGAIIALAALASAGAAAFGPVATTLAFHINMAVAALSVLTLARAKGNRRRDTWLGNFSYHIYILHWPVGLLVFTLLFDLARPDGSVASGAAASVTLIGCCVLSLLLTRWVDQPVERLRDRLRQPQGTATVAAP